MERVIGIYGIQDYNTFEFPGFTHDHSVCVMEDGRITDYLQLERLSRRKYDNRMHLHIEDLLDNHIKIDKDTVVVYANTFVGNSFISQNGRLRFECAPRKSLMPIIEAGEGRLVTEWDVRDVKSYSISHEIAHIGSCLPFYGKFKENSLLVHFDGGASLGNFSAFLYKDGLLHELECHWEMSHLSKLFNDNALSFGIMQAAPEEHNSVPGKLMGFAAMGQADPEIAIWLRENGFFKDAWNNLDVFMSKANEHFGWRGKVLDQHDSFIQNVAASLQSVFQEEFINKLVSLQSQYACDYLYFSGGCALNIMTNTAIIESGLFKDVFIPPCCSDSGLSIGAAAMFCHQSGIDIKQHSPYLNSIGCDLKPTSVCNHDLIRKVSDLLMDGKIIGVANGLGEAGPRALGNRSILARADSIELSCKISMQCKQREWYRPIAPIMLLKNAVYFTGLKNIHQLAMYMLLDFKVLEERISEIEGVVHQNKTARIQVLFDRMQNAFMFDLLTNLDERYGLKALINTSFNGKGEPIVHTRQDALQSASAMRLDYVVVDGVLIDVNKYK